jgi:hypothetical protein
MFGPNANISSSKQHYSLKILNEAEHVVSALKGSISEICSERQNTLIPRPVYLSAHTSYTLVRLFVFLMTSLYFQRKKYCELRSGNEKRSQFLVESISLYMI